MRQLYDIKINYNETRSFCYYNINGKRVKIYNGKKFNKNIYPNKEKDRTKRRALLEKLKKIIENELKPHSLTTKIYSNKKRAADNIYDQSIFKERIALDLYEHPKDGSIAVATEIAELIKKRQSQNKYCVIGLATGSSPISIYGELVRFHKEEGLSFNNVITFCSFSMK